MLSGVVSDWVGEAAYIRIDDRHHRIALHPSTTGGLLEIQFEIEGLDRQACGGTHLSNTAESGAVRIVKVENKGRHNRRIRLALANPA